MAKTTATATGNSLPSTLQAALSDLLDQDVRLSLELPDTIDISRVAIEVTADVDRDEPDDDEDAADDAAEGRHDEATERDDEGAPEPVAAVASEPEREASSADDVPDDQLDREVDAAADFVEGLLDAMDLDGVLELRLNDEEQSAEVEVVDLDDGVLIGRRGSTLEAVQELLRCVLQSQFDRRVRITVDVEGYRARRLEKLLDKADEAIDDVLDHGEPVKLEPMDVFERKAVHELVGTVEGIASRSQGREPSRRVVIEPS